MPPILWELFTSAFKAGSLSLFWPCTPSLRLSGLRVPAHSSTSTSHLAQEMLGLQVSVTRSSFSVESRNRTQRVRLCVWQELSPAEPSPWPIMCILKRLMAKHLSTLMWKVLPVAPAGGWLCRVGQRFARLIVHK